MGLFLLVDHDDCFRNAATSSWDSWRDLIRKAILRRKAALILSGAQNRLDVNCLKTALWLGLFALQPLRGCFPLQGDFIVTAPFPTE